MSKSQVPRGATRKELCKCGKFYYWNYCEGNSTTPRNLCLICRPAREQER